MPLEALGRVSVTLLEAAALRAEGSVHRAPGAAEGRCQSRIMCRGGIWRLGRSYRSLRSAGSVEGWMPVLWSRQAALARSACTCAVDPPLAPGTPEPPRAVSLGVPRQVPQVSMRLRRVHLARRTLQKLHGPHRNHKSSAPQARHEPFTTAPDGCLHAIPARRSSSALPQPPGPRGGLCVLGFKLAAVRAAPAADAQSR